ncbi:Lon protease [mine drainage metagenome]|uniref:Lon protease n=1 Tax=mine drainage metagenome TaxID=410659 RepID=A0A1J5RAT9_9ZZZZ
MVTRNNNTPAVLAGYQQGYTLAEITYNGPLLLLPEAVSKALVEDQKAAELAEEEKIRAEEAGKTATKLADIVACVPAQNADGTFNELSRIRVNTNFDLTDAQDLAIEITKRVPPLKNTASHHFSQTFLVAVILDVVYNKDKDSERSLKSVAEFIDHPGWDNKKQLIHWFINYKINDNRAFQQPQAAEWAADLRRKLESLSDDVAEVLLMRCSNHWKSALSCKAGKKKSKVRASIRIFDQAAISKARAAVLNAPADRRGGGEQMLDEAEIDEGFRLVPNPSKAIPRLEAFKAQFENLVDPISRLQMDLTLAAAMPPEEFRVTPILLLGDSGIGKTYLAMALADALGVHSDKITAGGTQGGFVLTGSHLSWTGARPGTIFTLLAEGKSATPVLVIDEVDKIEDGRFPVLPVLLDLFETKTARSFKDEFFEMQIDASRIIFVLTANSLEGVPAPLLSRVEVFDVPRPEPEQRLRIMKHEADQLRKMTKKKITLDKSSSEALAERVDIDLRKTTRLVREAFTLAMRAGEDVATLLLPKPTGRLRIGF